MAGQTKTVTRAALITTTIIAHLVEEQEVAGRPGGVASVTSTTTKVTQLMMLVAPAVAVTGAKLWSDCWCNVGDIPFQQCAELFFPSFFCLV